MSGIVGNGLNTSGNIGYKGMGVVQIVSKRSTTQYSTTGGWNDSGITMTITPKLARSHIHLTGILQVAMTNNSSNGGCSFKWKRSQSGQTDAYPNNLVSYDGSGTESYGDHWNQASWTTAEFNWKQPISGLDTTVHTAGSEVTYTLYSITYSLDGFVIGNAYDSDSFFQATEIAI